MAITPSYPGVYVQEISSGVRTITGVATSIAAFVGGAKRGPIDRAVRVLGYADYERRFGGLAHDSLMSYAVKQFFANGGGEAWIVRVAKSATKASVTLQNSRATPDNVLTVTAFDAGAAGNNIRVLVDYATTDPNNTFNLTVIYFDPNDPSTAVTERFIDLVMNSQSPRFVETVVNARSELVRVAKGSGALGDPGSLTGGIITALGAIDAAHNEFRIAVDGGEAVTVIFDETQKATVAQVKDAIALKLPAGVGVTLTTQDRLVFTSTATNEKSSVRILPGLKNDATAALMLRAADGASATDSAAVLRPKPGPLGASITSSGDVLDTSFIQPTPNNTTFKISLDDGPQRTVTITAPQPANPAGLAAKIQDAVRKLDVSDAYRNFTATTAAVPTPTGAPTKSKITLTSGTKGSVSKIALFAGDDLLKTLDLHTAVPSNGADIVLKNGTEVPFDVASPLASVIASRKDRQGLYALDSVDLFNILCLPGVTDKSTLDGATVYCEERRAFFIVDPPAEKDQPDEMEAYVTSTQLPKSNYAAVYYPWIRIGDPLNEGAPLSVPPSGTIAGVFARTDATRGVWKAPAGTDANLVGVLGADHVLTDRENGILNPRGVNCIRILPVYGAVAWGARTLRGDDAFADEWKYVPVRRLALFIEESLYRGTQWVVFEPNDEPLWSQIRLNVGAFMQNLFRQGAFQGRTPREAYLVKCDRETTTQNDINLGVVNILVGFAPLKPAEFVFIRIQQLAGQIQA